MKKNSSSVLHLPSSLKNKRILITCGPTWVAMDDMRVISNRSTGELGHILAKKLSAAKARVTLLEGPVTHSVHASGFKVLKFCFFDELGVLLKTELAKKYDCVIHAAAVSDFKPRKRFSKKIDSNVSKLTVDLVPTPKLINRIKTMSPKTFLVGFKLQDSMASAVEEIKKLFSQAHCDLIVANFLKSNSYEAFVVDSEHTLLGKVKSKPELCRLLIHILKDRL